MASWRKWSGWRRKWSGGREKEEQRFELCLSQTLTTLWVSSDIAFPRVRRRLTSTNFFGDRVLLQTRDASRLLSLRREVGFVAVSRRDLRHLSL